SSNTCVPPASGLVSWWRAEGNANDSVDGNGGTFVNGATITNGLVGGAFDFNGTSAYVQVPDGANLRFTTGVTFEAWVYVRAVGGTYHEIFSKWEGGVDQRSYLLAI